MPITRHVALLALLPALPAAHADPLAPAYTSTATFALGPPDHWDYMAYDMDTQRLFIAHDTELTVVAAGGRAGGAGTLTIAGRLTGLTEAHGIVLVPGGKGFVANGNHVTVFDPVTLRAQASIPVGDGADSMAFDPATGGLYVMNHDAGSISVINPQKNAVIATISTGGQLESGATDGHGNLFVNQVDTASVLRIDTATNKLTATYRMPGCERPHGLALDSWETRLFASCANGTMIIMDGRSGDIIAHPSIGFGSDAVIYDSARHMVFSSNSDGTLSVINAVTLASAGSIKTALGARTMALDPISGRVFLITAKVEGQGPPKPTGAPSLEFAPGTAKLLVFGPAG